MQFTAIDRSISRGGVTTKLGRVMKLTAILLLAAGLQVSAYSEGQKVTIKVRNVPLKTVFREIQKQTGLSILLDEVLLKKTDKVTLDVTNMEAQEVLSICFRNEPLTFSIVGDRIVIKRKNVTVQPVENFFNDPPPPIEITGRVVNEKNEPLPGVTVMLKNSKNAATTNAEGYFKINIPENTGVLVFSSVGYKELEMPVDNKKVVNVIMALAFSKLDNLVVTALGISRKSRSLVYAAQVLKPEELTGVRDPNNIINSLQGKVANAVISQGSGGPGSGARIVLRGNRSIQGSSNALIVVDGVPIINGTSSTLTSDFTSTQGSDGTSIINPDDIESVTVLPGATAAALYGSEAGNGVIVITTKKGSKDKISVTLNSGIVADKVFSLPEFQNTYGQGNGGNLAPTSGVNWGAKMTGQSYTNFIGEQRTYSPEPNNVKDFFRTGISLNNSIGISGGTEKAQTYLSYTNNDIQGIVPKNDLERHTINLRVSNQLSKRFSTDAKVTYLIQNIKHRPATGEGNSAVMNVFQTPRNLSDQDNQQYQTIGSDGIPVQTPWPKPSSSANQNPYWIVNNTDNTEDRNRITGFLSARYQLTDWLSISGRANLDKITDRREEIYFQGTNSNANSGGYYIKRYANTQQKWFDFIISGTNKITEDIKVDYNAGGIYKSAESQLLSNFAIGLNVPNKFNLNFAKASFFIEEGDMVKTQSVFGQANFSYKNALFLDVSLRNDWASTLPAPHSFMYYSAGASAILSDLFTLPASLSFLKLNLNYARVGNGGRFGLLNSVYNYAPGGTNGLLSRSSVFPIPGLKPELVTSLEGGVEAMFLNNRLGFTLTYYKSLSTNQLLTIDLPPATGYASKYINAGEIQNNGLELILNAKPVKSKDFNWDLAFNFSLNRNKINKLSDDLKEVSLSSRGTGRGGTPIIKEGGSYGDLISYKWARDAKGNLLVTADGLPLTTDKNNERQTYIGNFNPKENLGLTNTFTYKRVSLSFLIDGRIGGVVISGTEMNLSFSGIPKVTEQHREGGWSLGGVDANGQLVSQTISAQQFWQTASGLRDGIGEFFAYDATNFRVRELSIGYNIPLKSNFLIKSARFSLVGRNLLWLYRGSSILNIPGLGKRKMRFDPDMSLGNGNYQGIEYGTMPSTRSIGANLLLNF